MEQDSVKQVRGQSDLGAGVGAGGRFQGDCTHHYGSCLVWRGACGGSRWREGRMEIAPLSGRGCFVFLKLLPHPISCKTAAATPVPASSQGCATAVSPPLSGRGHPSLEGRPPPGGSRKRAESVCW